MNNSIYTTVFRTVREHFHERRADVFITLMKPFENSSILDLGGGTGDFLARIRDRMASSAQARLVVAEIGAYYARHIRENYGFEFVLLEENQPLPFGDKEFDIVISNSVIEHVTFPKHACMSKISDQEWNATSFERQKQFANDIQRISKAYFVQTPHKYFPIETHTWLPFVNRLSHDHTMSVVSVANKYWIKKCQYVDWHLLSDRDMQKLFPGSKIHIERSFGLPKSVIAYS